MSSVIHADEGTFEKAVLQSDTPVLVDFGQLGVVHVKPSPLY